MELYEANVKRCFLGRLEKGDDLLDALETFVTSNEIRMGTINLVGAVSKATIAFYNQKTNEYESKTFNQDLEIVSCTGNISMKENRPMIHMHIALADNNGSVFGGHLMKNTTVFAAEFITTELEGDIPIRSLDPKTNLFLWHREYF